MKPTNEELRAAIENGLAMLDDQGFPTDAAILRAHLETFDEERAFLDACEALGAKRYKWFPAPMHPTQYLNQEDRAFDLAYRALVAKREGTP